MTSSTDEAHGAGTDSREGKRRGRRLVLPLCVTAAAVALIALLVFGLSTQRDSSSIDAKVAAGRYPPAPKASVALPVLGGHHTRSLKSYRGKVVVLNFYASWCEACSAESAVLSNAERTLARQNGTVLGVTYEDAESATEAFDHKHGVAYPVLRDPTGSLPRAFGTYQIPETFILDRSGRIVALRRYGVNAAWLGRQIHRAQRLPS